MFSALLPSAINIAWAMYIQIYTVSVCFGKAVTIYLLGDKPYHHVQLVMAIFLIGKLVPAFAKELPLVYNIHSGFNLGYHILI